MSSIQICSFLLLQTSLSHKKNWATFSITRCKLGRKLFKNCELNRNSYFFLLSFLFSFSLYLQVRKKDCKVKKKNKKRNLFALLSNVLYYQIFIFNIYLYYHVLYFNFKEEKPSTENKQKSHKQHTT